MSEQEQSFGQGLVGCVQDPQNLAFAAAGATAKAPAAFAKVIAEKEVAEAVERAAVAMEKVLEGTGP